MRIGNREFDLKNNTYIMGILNVTPDSFSDGGKFHMIDKALFRVEEMIKEGADIIDVGGESTRPGSTIVEAADEILRVIPIISAIKKNFDIPVSLDTYKGSVAQEGINAGADLINDIWGLKHDDEISRVVAENDLPCCIMHNRKKGDYEDFMQDVLSDLEESLTIAKSAGISDDKIILDPGVGFKKNRQQNLKLMNNLQVFTELGYPVLLGTSRKSVIGLTLDLPVDERVEGTLVTTVLAVQNKCGFVRVHDIKENYRAIKMTRAIMNA